MREREKKREGIRKKEEKPEREKEKEKEKIKYFFLLREEREFNKILLLFFSYSTIAVACILSISSAKNSNIVI